jgi:hypothetical protein
MRIHMGVACATIAILAGIVGCGSYSGPSNSDNDPTPPADSTGSNTPTPPPGYLQS